MYNKKCKNTFLFLTALLCLITLILPFMRVGFFGEVSLFLKIIYYFTISIYVISIILIILIGVFSLFTNNYSLLSFQEILSYLAFIMLFINLLIFVAIDSITLSVGYSLLCLETFVMATFDDIFKLIKKLPRTFKNLSKTIEEKRKQNIQNKLQEEKIKFEQQMINIQEQSEENIPYETLEEEVNIIPPDEDLI